MFDANCNGKNAVIQSPVLKAAILFNANKVILNDVETSFVLSPQVNAVDFNPIFLSSYLS